jgi:hypothetical protein
MEAITEMFTVMRRLPARGGEAHFGRERGSVSHAYAAHTWASGTVDFALSLCSWPGDLRTQVKTWNSVKNQRNSLKVPGVELLRLL